MIRFDDILEKVSGSYSEKDVNFLKKAYVFAGRAHKGQTRRSGEPYLSHPLEVANMLADLRLDKTTLAAGLLHDVLEDTEVIAGELRESFGKEVADLVEGVTKIGRVQDTAPETRQAETVRKIILAMTNDLRVIFIKLADRIHNLKTLNLLPINKQKQIGRETLEIYAPIANRLGMGRFKAELEDMSFRYVSPDEFFRISSLIEPEKQKAEEELQRFKATLESLMKEHNISAEIQYRIKRPYSIYTKMQSRGINFDQVYDFLALRIITDSRKSCYAALGIIHQKWTPLPQRFRDFIAMPKPNLYQALHTTIITAGKQTLEIQIRTREMHGQAENGIAAHWKYKDRDPSTIIKEDRRLAWLREMAEIYREQKSPQEFLKNLKVDLIPEEVYVFTPKGKTVTLPLGASALDFAFRIHSEIGLHAAGATINGKASPLKTILKTGDIVEIISSPEKTPQRNWLNTAFTSTARHQIKRWLNQQEKTRSVRLGRNLWEKALKKYTLPAGLENPEALLDILQKRFPFKMKSMEDFFALAGVGKIIVDARFMSGFSPEGRVDERKETFLQKVIDRVSRKKEVGILVRGVEGELVSLARCCAPIKGEPVIGYLVSGKGVTVHSTRCPLVSREILDSKRMVEVSWGAASDEGYKGKLLVQAADSPGVLAKVATDIAQSGGNITKAEVTTDGKGKTRIKIILTIRDIRHLEDIKKRISRSKEILSVERV